MSIGEFCNREVVVAEPGCSVLEAARLMRRHHVGALVVVAAGNGANSPIGVVTDRDLVVEVMAAHLDPETVRVGEVMSEPPCSARPGDGILETMRLMREHGVRRLPVIGEDGSLRGIVAIDDLIPVLAGELNELSGLLVRERATERQTRK